MKISRHFSTKDWVRLKFDSEADWAQAILILKDRLEARYLEHIRILLHRRNSGFAVLTLDCALIETLEQFRRGKQATPSRKGKEYFISFLTTTDFSKHFSAKIASAFYTQIRCGLLHQTETDGHSKIKHGDSLPLISEIMNGTGLIINKQLFHLLLEKVISRYLMDLENPENVTLRQSFRSKMDSICRADRRTSSM